MKTSEYRDKILNQQGINLYNNYKGYVLFETDDIFQCYRLQSIDVNFPMSYYDETVTVSGIVENNITSACELDKLTKSVAYSNTLHEYKNLINDIKNKRKELQGLKNDVEREGDRLRKVIRQYKEFEDWLHKFATNTNEFELFCKLNALYESHRLNWSDFEC